MNNLAVPFISLVDLLKTNSPPVAVKTGSTLRPCRNERPPNSRLSPATEIRVRAHGITGWRRGSKLTGRTDFVFLKLPPSPRLRRTRKLAVFVDGCFWRGCPKHGTSPKANAAFWLTKITGNKARDRRVNRLLRAKGWRVLRIWEHELARKNERRPLARLRRAPGFTATSRLGLAGAGLHKRDSPSYEP